MWQAWLGRTLQVVGARETKFAEMYDQYASRVLAYASRHGHPDQADDVLSETFAVAWRRIDDVPEPALGWLIQVARNVISGRHRAWRRQTDLFAAYLDTHRPQLSAAEPAAEVVAVRRASMLHALDVLSEHEREALLLTAWDGLSHEEAAEVARCSPRAFRARLTRARARLDVVLSDLDVEVDEPNGVRR
jgi:RNA polymerase sigma factor (sigma-70 family)